MSDHKSEQHAPDTASTEVNEQPPQSMEEELADLKTKLAEMQDNFLRAKAEAENIRRRAAEDIAKAHKFAIENFAEHLIPVSDSLYAALATEAGDAKAFKEGLEITLKQLVAAFEKGRLVEINPTPGAKFDPHQHQAISMVPSDQEANTVVSVLQRGFLIADRVLRPALVTVSQAK
ncbi:MAG: nucleotide exchange factor GrpE [Burkholderiaceae bacterium]|jgi:molecular chaperone GrpE|uniref:nucleotide exchange factor GrpE n=1 Tax=Polynucleobacter sp. HIN8 TaxID=3047867 RepID=UPI001D21E30E|nr:nucleotide exchange factor GrpE [Polynucleobacter sp. HIN8]MBU6321947.1 nucleotide exchange factor GrpE [Burkholderiales bacterium]NBP19729.1 nucleotide exchange factor GrpE [Burkholderiaceae bacterium]NBP96391.1 nucleotide exchange factor GrpE [Burkholderiaceae bacterium]NCA09322.1 nucleotide exchange factor GrpE [Burkholderiaceae bacterium]NCU92924.1 nucleotide exchange factor GrpE [Burkholderiaceae bacterium]